MGKVHLQLSWDKTAKETSLSNSLNLDVRISISDIEIRHYHMEHQRGKINDNVLHILKHQSIKMCLFLPLLSRSTQQAVSDTQLLKD